MSSEGTKSDCEHSSPDYYGRCAHCGQRLEAPSQWMQDEAKRIGGQVVSFTKTFIIPTP